MNVETRIESAVLHIMIVGRFDFGVHKEFRDAINLIEPGIKKIEVDLSATDYVDSSALGMLLLLRDKVAADRNAVELKGARADVRKILEIANFNKLFVLS